MNDAFDPETGEVRPPRPRGIGANSRLVTDAEFEVSAGTPTCGHNSGMTDPEEQRVDDALHTLEENIDVLALAAGNRVYAEQMRKAIKAMLMKEHADKAIGVQERESYSDPRYIEHLEKQRRWEMEFWKAHGRNAHAKEVISVYKTRCANRRPQNKF